MVDQIRILGDSPDLENIRKLPLSEITFRQGYLRWFNFRQGGNSGGESLIFCFWGCLNFSVIWELSSGAAFWGNQKWINFENTTVHVIIFAKGPILIKWVHSWFFMNFERRLEFECCSGYGFFNFYTQDFFIFWVFKHKTKRIGSKVSKMVYIYPTNRGTFMEMNCLCTSKD